jgi:hypothetical protein
MKITKSLFFLFFITLQNLFAQDFSNPVEYLNFIGTEQENISQSMWKYTSAVAHSKSARKIDNTRKDLIKIIQNASKKIAGLKNGYKSDLEYRDQVIAYLNISEKNIKEEYDKIINMQEVADQSYDYMEAYIMTRDLINKKIEEENTKVVNAQKAFAKKYNITLTENNTELGKKIEISNEVFKYHTQMYLLFFKANITDLYLSNAIEKKDLGAIQQNANTLDLYATEGIEKLKEIKPFRNDNTLVLATLKSLEYYKKQVKNYVPTITSFYLLKEKLDKAKTTLESKSEKDRTKEEIDNFNAMINQFNKEVKNYNQSSQLNFKEKSEAVNLWNQTGERFISNNIPQ